MLVHNMYIYTCSLYQQVQYMDTVGVNFYASWYVYAGHPETIPYQLSIFLEQWHDSFKKPFFMSEYGAGAISGIHMVRSSSLPLP